MAASKLTTSEIGPATQILDADGRDWAWAFAIFRPMVDKPGYWIGSDGSTWTRWTRGPGPKSPLGPFRRLAISSDDRWGHRSVRLSVGGIKKPYQVHRLVLETFLGPCPPGKECCHADGRAWNNIIQNLRWDTHRNNERDKLSHGTDNRGEKAFQAKLRNADAVEVRRLVASGVPQREIAERFGVCRSSICHVASGDTYSHLPIRDAQAGSRCPARGERLSGEMKYALLELIEGNRDRSNVWIADRFAGRYGRRVARALVSYYRRNFPEGS